MRDYNLKTALIQNRLFSGMSIDVLEEALETSEIREYLKGDDLFGDRPALYYMISGKARVYRTDAKSRVILNNLSKGSVFGVAGLFGSSGNSSSVIALTKCRCVLFRQDAVEKMLSRDFNFTRNYISFLSDRIRFLNGRIESFTAGDGERSLAAYILKLPSDNGYAEICLKMSAVAAALNMSRPTLYRSFAALCGKGLIEKDGSRIKIISREKLMSI